MKKLFIIAALFISNGFAGTVEDNLCKVPQSSTRITMVQEMQHTMKINPDSIDESKTTTELIANNPVDDAFITQLAMQDKEESINKNILLESYKELYTQYHPRNLIIKFTFKNKANKENIFLVSALANDSECNARFNGYIIVKREF